MIIIIIILYRIWGDKVTAYAQQINPENTASDYNPYGINIFGGLLELLSM
jgi:hypothetical protein